VKCDCHCYVGLKLIKNHFRAKYDNLYTMSRKICSVVIPTSHLLSIFLNFCKQITYRHIAKKSRLKRLQSLSLSILSYINFN
jgi:hypothetical protein